MNDVFPFCPRFYIQKPARGPDADRKVAGGLSKPEREEGA